MATSNCTYGHNNPIAIVWHLFLILFPFRRSAFVFHPHLQILVTHGHTNGSSRQLGGSQQFGIWNLGHGNAFCLAQLQMLYLCYSTWIMNCMQLLRCIIISIGVIRKGIDSFMRCCCWPGHKSEGDGLDGTWSRECQCGRGEGRFMNIWRAWHRCVSETSTFARLRVEKPFKPWIGL